MNEFIDEVRFFLKTFSFFEHLSNHFRSEDLLLDAIWYFERKGIQLLAKAHVLIEGRHFVCDHGWYVIECDFIMFGCQASFLEESEETIGNVKIFLSWWFENVPEDPQEGGDIEWGMLLHDFVQLEEVLLGQSLDYSFSCKLDHHWVFSHIDDTSTK